MIRHRPRRCPPGPRRSQSRAPPPTAGGGAPPGDASVDTEASRIPASGRSFGRRSNRQPGKNASGACFPRHRLSESRDVRAHADQSARAGNRAGPTPPSEGAEPGKLEPGIAKRRNALRIVPLVLDPEVDDDSRLARVVDPDRVRNEMMQQDDVASTAAEVGTGARADPGRDLFDAAGLPFL